MIILTPEQVDATVKRVLPQIPEGRTGALVTDVDANGVTFAAEIEKKTDAWTLNAEAAFQWDWTHNTESVGARVVWSW